MEGTRGAVNGALQGNMMGEVLAAFVVGGPVRADAAHVEPEGLRDLEGRQGPALSGLARPMVFFARSGDVPAASCEGAELIGVHALQYSAVVSACRLVTLETSAIVAERIRSSSEAERAQ